MSRCPTLKNNNQHFIINDRLHVLTNKLDEAPFDVNTNNISHDINSCNCLVIQIENACKKIQIYLYIQQINSMATITTIILLTIYFQMATEDYCETTNT